MSLWRIFSKKFLSSSLIASILISQTVQVSFFDPAEARPQDYSDVVSIFVDGDTYRALRGKINQYAEDIQTYLGSTRTTIHITSLRTTPEEIASVNEKLYYEGDGGNGSSNLVGTILIGNVPIPLVHKDTKEFPSLYPYVDFEDKYFVFDASSGQYEYNPKAPVAGDVEVWHGVINPSIGGKSYTSDQIAQIGGFLDKTHDFYIKQGIFTADRFTDPPRVLYYDGFLEQKSLNYDDLFAYALYMGNIENIAYKRFSKYLLRDLVEFLNLRKQSTTSLAESDLFASLGVDTEESIFPLEQIDTLPDIQTKTPIEKLTKKFFEIINAKSLGDIRRMVYNAGRYNDGSRVRVDQPALSITSTDQVAMDTIREANTAIENAIDASIQGMSSRIILFDQYRVQLPNNPKGPLFLPEFVYNNYFFGTKASTITAPAMCTLARGSNLASNSVYGQSILAEANKLFDISTAQTDIDRLRVDTERLVDLHRSDTYSCFTQVGDMKLDSYWGNNSVLRIGKDANADLPNPLLGTYTSALTNFSLPIFSLGGMRETTRFRSASPVDCIDPAMQYAIIDPYIYEYRGTKIQDEIAPENCKISSLDEWNRTGGTCKQELRVPETEPRFTCNSIHKDIPVVFFKDVFASFSKSLCTEGKITIDNTTVAQVNNVCSSAVVGGNEGDTVDDTKKVNIVYHTIPSIVYHKSPTDEEIQAATINNATPSIAIDTDRYVEFLSPKGIQMHLTYPNFFRMNAHSIAEARLWLTNFSQNQWEQAIAAENARILTPEELQIQPFTSPGVFPTSPIDWNDYISDAVLEKVIRSKLWLQPDVAKKYSSSIEASLSFSKNQSAIDAPPYVPDNKGGYEIVYLGLKNINPGEASGNSAIDSATSDIDIGLARLRAANMSEPGSEDHPNTESNACGSPDGVELQRWFPAIVCWMKNLLPPRITAGSCTTNTIGSNNSLTTLGLGNPVSPGHEENISGERMKQYLEGSKLILHLPRTSLFTSDSITVEGYLVKNGSPVSLPTPARVEYRFSNFVNGVEFSPGASPYVDAKSSTVLTVKRDTQTDVEMRAVFTYDYLGQVWTTESDPITLRIRDEHLDPSPMLAGIRVGYIDVTDTRSVGLSVDTIAGTSEKIPSTPPFVLSLYDDVSGVALLRNINAGPDYLFPTTITKKTGVYRIMVTDASWRVGESTFSVRSGPADHLSMTSLSNRLFKGGKTPISLSVLDAQNNVARPDLYELTIRVNGGYILDSSGKKTTQTTYSIVEGGVDFTVGSDIPGNLTITASLKDPNINLNKTLSVSNDVQILIERSGVPIVGGSPVDVTMKILDPATGQIVSDFSSISAFAFPQEAGTFSSSIIPIINGESGVFRFKPGKKAGNHLLALDIPGIGTIEKVIFSTKPDIPMYIGITKEATSVKVSLLDRYGNISPVSSDGEWFYNADAPENISFVGGVAQIPKKSGYLMVTVPSIAGNYITIAETNGAVTKVDAIPRNILYIPAETTKYDFPDDYNGLYTVLAGGSFFTEASDILYSSNTTSASLAVSTLLDDPYEENSVISLSPGGGYSFTSVQDSIVRPTFLIKEGLPVMEWYDDAHNELIAESVVHIKNAELSICEVKNSEDSSCFSDLPVASSIRLIGQARDDRTIEKEGDTLVLRDNEDNTLFQIDTHAVFSISPLLTLTPRVDASAKSMVFDIMNGSDILASVLIQVYTNATPLYTTTPYTPTDIDSLATNIITTGFDVKLSPLGTLSSGRNKLHIVSTSSEATLDTDKLGPLHISSLGSLDETSGVGWQGQNVSLLSFAAGDTVGQATKWAHTFTLVNLGDPVAHIDVNRNGVSKEGIDRSIGTKIVSGSHGRIRQTVRKDVNNDGYDDLVVWYTSGYAELVLNLGDRMRSRGNILHVADISDRGVDGGDFTGDKFADMVYINNSGSLIVLDNTSRKWTRKPLEVSGASPPEGVVQLKIFDMDKDGRDDIVYLSEEGELAILYGTQVAGVFTKNLLDGSLGVEIDPNPTTEGGAIHFSSLPDFPPGFTTQEEKANTTPDAVSPTMLRSKIYYQRIIPTVTTQNNQIAAVSSSLGSDSTIDPSTLYTDIQALDPQGTPNLTVNTYKTFVRSEYSIGHNVDIKKTYQNLIHSTLHAGDPIEVNVSITNTDTNNSITDVEYLDKIPPFLKAADIETYTINRNGTSEKRTLDSLSADEFDYRLPIGTIGPRETVIIRYTLTALPAAYGDMIVGLLEGGEIGDDIYGDVGFNTQTTCGADILLWRSTAIRSYERGTRTFTSPDVPADIKQYLLDANGNGTPDYIENMSLEERTRRYEEIQTSDNPTNISPRVSVDGTNRAIDIGVDPATQQEIENFTQNLANGLNCGFGGGSCMSFPINWAPLAPGSDPAVFGMPVGDGLKVDEGIPIFSALTGIPIYGPWGCFPMPAVWPLSPIGYDSTCSSNTSNAGGMLGIDSPTNFLRIFITPTLTLGMGAAICMGGSARMAGGQPAQGISPLVSGGNCIVIAKPMSMCKADGSKSDGDVTGFSGLGSLASSWNGSSCKIKQGTVSSADRQSFTQDVIDYIRNPDNSRIPGIYRKLSGLSINGGAVSTGPLLRMGRNTSGGGLDAVNVEYNSRDGLSFGGVEKVKNKVVAAFPEFITDWVTRQMEEITNSLASPPNLFVVLPRAAGQNAQIDSSFVGFGEKVGNAYSQKNLENFFRTVSAAKASSIKANRGTTVSNSQAGVLGRGSTAGTAGTAYSSLLGDTVNSSSSTINEVAGGAAGMRAAYDFIGKLPFIRVERVTIPINVPWILPRDLDKYERRIKMWGAELDTFKRSSCIGVSDPSQCVNNKGTLQANALITSINENLRILESYKKFPEKLQKYLTWKQRYISQILCNVDTYERMVGGWLRDNGRRFRAWIEFYILLKAMLKSWEPLPDLFTNYKRSCGVCRNERYDLKYFQFKLISAVMPKLPILRFPRWPDIVLNLSDIRFGITLRMPEFRLNMSPIRLPELGNLTLPRGPNVSLALPNLPRLPPIPNLPNLPDLPSLPRITLPDLPSPPKLPKIFGSVKATLSILSLMSKVMCLYEKTTLVPEWRVGNIIAERTERQSASPIDFINIDIPQITLGFLKEIRVSTHINYELRTDFITEMANAAVKPINSFTTDMTRALPTQIGPSVNISTPPNIQLRVPRPGGFNPDSTSTGGVSSIDDREVHKTIAVLTEKLQQDSKESLTVDEFKNYIRTEMKDVSPSKDRSLYDALSAVANTEDHTSERLTKELLDYNTKKFALLREYLSAEGDTLVEFQKIIDTLRDDSNQELVYNDGIFTSALTDRAKEKEKIFASYQDGDTTSDIAVINPNTRESIRQIESSLGRMAVATTGPTSTSSSPGVPDGYAPSFRGIYILTPSGLQTRLFDYTEPLRGTEKADVTDIDTDGDNDYIFLLDNALYIKYNHTNSPAKNIDTASSLYSVSTGDVQTAPNYFAEITHEVGYINTNFTPARESDRVFRLEFYDHMLEWDMDDIGTPTPGARKTVVDLVARSNDSIRVNSDVSFSSNPLYAKTVTTQGGLRLVSTNYFTHTTGEVFSITNGKPIYTGDERTTITYRVDGITEKPLTLEPHSTFTFGASADVRIEGGRVFIFDTTGERTTTDPEVIRGMPILPDMKIYTDVGDTFVIQDTTTNTMLGVADGTDYYSYDLGEPQESYSLRFPYQNGWYYARLLNIDSPGTTAARVTLLAPQSGADRDPPLIDLPDSLSIPVYNSRNIDLKSAILEKNKYTLIWDSNLTKDANNNGIPDDDLMGSSGDGISLDSAQTTLSLGTFDKIENRLIKLSATDEFGNTSTKDITLKVYAPIPDITRANREGSILGALDEKIENEPVDFIRVREGSALTRLSSTLMTDKGGVFQGDISTANESIEIRHNQDVITLPNGGRIETIPPGYSTVVDGATVKSPMKVTLLDAEGKSVYSTFLVPPASLSPRGLTSVNQITQDGIYVIPTLPYKWIAALPSDPAFALGGYIVDADSRAIAAVHRDGNIYPLVQDITLTYSVKGQDISITLLQRGAIVAEVVYRFDPFFATR